MLRMGLTQVVLTRKRIERDIRILWRQCLCNRVHSEKEWSHWRTLLLDNGQLRGTVAVETVVVLRIKAFRELRLQLRVSCGLSYTYLRKRHYPILRWVLLLC